MGTLDEGLDLAKDQIDPTVKFICRAVLIGVMCFFVTVAGCTAHSNTFDKERGMAEAEQKRAEAEYKKAEAEIVAAKSKAEIEQTKAIERLIAAGTDPIAARCAVIGWTDNDTTCLVISKK